MMKRTLPLLLSAIMAQSAFMTQSAFAAISLEGQTVKNLVLKKNAKGKIVIKSVQFVDGETPAPPACIDDPDDPDCTGPTFCEENPEDASCEDVDPGTIPPDDNGICGTEGQNLVYETLNWASQPGQRVIDIPKTAIVASKFKTTDSLTFRGSVQVGPTTGLGHVGRNIWISTCPGKPALEQEFACEVNATEAILKWSQEPDPRSRTECKLELDTVYYINYRNEGCTSSTCTAFRNTYHNGQP